MKKYYSVQDLLTWNTVQLNEIALSITETEPKQSIMLNDKEVPNWYILALNIKIIFEIQKHIKENGINIPEIELDFEEINEQFKTKNNDNNGEYVLAEQS